MWSKELTELSREYFNYDNTHIKSQNGDFGILNIDYKNKIWAITLLQAVDRPFTGVYNDRQTIVLACKAKK
ncbi:MAG: hypothetical protein LBE02_06740 [Spirochaetaceae bacterium]|jgi:hypothetical protein|nr:hypothetical protein [Spirochaetaceae bacterium]